MTDSSDTNREERVIDALIVAALRADLHRARDLVPDASNALTEEDRRALACLGPDVIAKLLAGHSENPAIARNASQRDLATAMNRADDDTELSEAAREEMERGISDSQSADNRDEDDQA